MDILSVWNKQLSIKEKSSLTYTLSILKLKKWINKKSSIIHYPLLQYHLEGSNNESMQVLVKEIFIDMVYDVRDVLEPSAQLRIIDAGSNVGLSILFFKRCFKNSVIEAYEPNETSFMLLQKNMERNNIKEVHLVQAAINDSDQLLFAEAGFEHSSINQTFSITGNPGKPVASVRLASLLQQKKADCVKLDIEGDEIKVLEDVIRNNCLTNVRCWLIEFHNKGEQREQIINEFKKNGFVYKLKKDVYCFMQTEKSGK